MEENENLKQKLVEKEAVCTKREEEMIIKMQNSEMDHISLINENKQLKEENASLRITLLEKEASHLNHEQELLKKLVENEPTDKIQLSEAHGINKKLADLENLVRGLAPMGAEQQEVTKHFMKKVDDLEGLVKRLDTKLEKMEKKTRTSVLPTSPPIPPKPKKQTEHLLLDLDLEPITPTVSMDDPLLRCRLC